MAPYSVHDAARVGGGRVRRAVPLRAARPGHPRPDAITSAALLVVGGIAVFFHLEHWERIFNGFGHLTSGITQELIAIIVLFVAMVVYFVYLRRGGDDAKVPTWLAAIGLVLAVVLVAVMGHS